MPRVIILLAPYTVPKNVFDAPLLFLYNLIQLLVESPHRQQLFNRYGPSTLLAPSGVTKIPLKYPSSTTFYSYLGVISRADSHNFCIAELQIRFYMIVYHLRKAGTQNTR